MFDEKSKLDRKNKIGLKKLIAKIESNLNLTGFDFVGANGLQLDSQNNLLSTNEDSQVYLKPNTSNVIYEMSYFTPREESEVEIYGAYDENYTYYNEEKRYLTNTLNTSLYVFKEPLTMLRVDPTNKCGENVQFSFVIQPHKVVDKKKPAIVLVSHDLTKTGAPLLLFNMAKQLKKDYNVLFLSAVGGELEEELKKENIKYINLEINLLAERNEWNINVDLFVKNLYSVGYRKVILNTILTASLSKSFYERGFYVSSLIHEMKTSIKYYGFGKYAKDLQVYAHKMVFADMCVKRDYETLFGSTQGKALIQPQGRFININSEKKKIKKSKTILGLGTFSLRKGSDLFVYAALELLSIAQDDYEFIWVGKNSEKDLFTWVKHSVEQSDFVSKIKFYEHLPSDEYSAILARADALWLTSREDPYPSVMIDAIYYEIPVFAFFNTGGANTVLDNNRGILIKNYNLNELANQTILVLNDDKRRTEMISLAKRYVYSQLSLAQYCAMVLDEGEKIR